MGVSAWLTSQIGGAAPQVAAPEDSRGDHAGQRSGGNWSFMAAQTKAPRHDPPHRDADPEKRWSGHGALKNRDPGKHYLLSNMPGADFGVDYWEALGYVTEQKREGGPSFGTASKAEGGAVTLRDQVLMSCPIEAFRDREQNGETGNTGLRMHDRIEAQILDREKGPWDPMRGTRERFGQNARFLRVENDSSTEMLRG